VQYLPQPPKKFSEAELISPVTSHLHFFPSAPVVCKRWILFFKRPSA